MKKYFVTAIGTGCGKTLASAILCESMGFDYWKPIQSGTDETDRLTVSNLVSNPNTNFHPERFLLQTPVSPHQSARIDQVEINISDFILPQTNNNLIIEGAGGILVPINFGGEFVIDIAQKFDCEVILVSNLYLGSINHTLLTINELKKRNMHIKGIIFNGNSNEYSEKLILQHLSCPCILRINQEDKITKETIKKYAGLINFK